MKLPRRPARPGPPGRSRARPAAVLAVAIACAALIVAAGGSQRALAAGPGRPVAAGYGGHRRAPGSRHPGLPVPVTAARSTETVESVHPTPLSHRATRQARDGLSYLLRHTAPHQTQDRRLPRAC